MNSAEKRAKKEALIKKLYQKFTTHKQILVVKLLNVGSRQVQAIRKNLEKMNSELLIGKNTVIRKALNFRIKNLEESNPYYEDLVRFGKEGIPELEKLSNLIKGKIGLIFSDVPPYELKPMIEENRIETAAKVGAIAPCDVIIPTGPTGLDPSQISFFHALKMSTKIQKGQIELMKEFQACSKGRVVGTSEATLLQKLNIKPFLFGMELLQVYSEGAILSQDVLSLKPSDLLSKFSQGVQNVLALSMSTGIPIEASVPIMLRNGFQNIAAIAMNLDYEMKQLKAMQSAAAAVVQKVSVAKEEQKKVEKKEEPQAEEKQEEENVDMGDLFGDFGDF